ncbi:peroxisomal coenzyme A diphosphatase NUDT7 isoform X2 [Centroberyx affinis]|uniref:peroxisomal coenzyme A diphosphatase NUDT7 isoform X2 n=1 Tax=Centroberyx affinis TaxID=166261 RepID=UPI003A5C2BA0
MATKEEAIATLKRFEIGNRFSYLPVLPKASVLIPLFVRRGELCVLMTLRSKELRTSAGEVCFPGGKRDPSDAGDVDTALREAQEEIGLPADQVEVVCRLFPIIKRSVGDPSGWVHRGVILSLSEPSGGQCRVLRPPGLLHQGEGPLGLRPSWDDWAVSHFPLYGPRFRMAVSHLGSDRHVGHTGFCPYS